MTAQRAPAEQTSALNRAVVRRIKMELAGRDWSQSDLAKRLGEGEKWLSRRMRLEVPLSLDELERIARIFEKGVPDLLPAHVGRASEDISGCPRTSDRPERNQPSGRPGKIERSSGRAGRHERTSRVIPAQRSIPQASLIAA